MIEEMKEKNRKDVETIQDSHKMTLDLLTKDKDKTMETL